MRSQANFHCYKLRTVVGQLYFDPAWRDTQWPAEAGKGKAYETGKAASSAAKGFIRATNGKGYHRLQEFLGHEPRVTDLEVVEFSATEVGSVPV